jgi:LacI family transcriptional regulator
LITIKEMAQIIGISQTTVSNVIHGKTKEVSQKTIDEVKKVIEEYHYVPNMSARALAKNSSKIIGVIIRYPRIKNRNAAEEPFNGELAGSLEMNIRKAGYYMMFYCPNEVEGVLNFSSTWNVDGLIVLGLTPAECQKIYQYVKKPMVFIDSYFYDDGNPYVNVGLDDQQGAYEMTKYLIEQGHKKIGFFANNCFGVDEERWKGYLRALDEFGVHSAVREPYLLGQLPDELEKSLQRIYAQELTLTASFFSSDYFALNAIRFLREKGLKVPDDVSVAGFDDNVLAKNAYPKLTTVHQDPTMKGKLAVKQLIRLINNQPLEQNNIKLPTNLVIRDSVRKIEE